MSRDEGDYLHPEARLWTIGEARALAIMQDGVC